MSVDNVGETGILLQAEGDAFEGGKFDLRSLEIVLYNYRLIIDHSLPLIVGQKTLTDRIRNEVKYAVEIRKGSLEIILNFIFDHRELLALFSADGGYQLSDAISKLLRGAIDLRRALTKILENGSQPTIKIDQSVHTDNSVNYDIKTGDIILNNPQFIVVADATKAPFDRLIRGIDGNSVSKVDLSYKNTVTSLLPEDQDITGTQKEELATHIEVLGRLDMVAFTPHRGHIITGNKRYPVTWDDQMRSKIRQLVDTEGVVFRVRPIVDHRQFKDEPIGFHILDCWVPQTRLSI